MEIMTREEGKKIGIPVQDKAFFHSDTHINLESTDVKKVLTKVIQKNSSKYYYLPEEWK